MVFAAAPESVNGYAAVITPILLFVGAIVTQFYQNRNLKRDNERLANKDDDTNLLRFAEALQKQADTNYKAYQDAEQSRQLQYKRLLEMQDALLEARHQYALLKAQLDSGKVDPTA